MSTPIVDVTRPEVIIFSFVTLGIILLYHGLKKLSKNFNSADTDNSYRPKI